MKVFISWSEAASRLVAKALNDWLRSYIQAVKPFYSPEIEKGAKWSNEVDAALEGTRFGIICLTPDNLGSPWIHYEAGGLAKNKDALIWTFLVDVKPSDVKQPLGKFQHTLAEKSDILTLFKTINLKLAEVGIDPLDEKVLEKLFEDSWADLEAKINKAKLLIKTQSDDKTFIQRENVRNDNDKLNEMLELLRNLQRQEIPDNSSILISGDLPAGIQRGKSVKKIQRIKLNFNVHPFDKTDEEVSELTRIAYETININYRAYGYYIERDSSTIEIYFNKPIAELEAMDIVRFLQNHNFNFELKMMRDSN